MDVTWRRPTAAGLIEAARRVFASALVVIALLAASVLAPNSAASDEGGRTRSAVDYALFPQAEVADAADCALTAGAASGGPIVDFGPKIKNPAVTCPDSFAWSLLAKAVHERFWSTYGTDATMFPQAPWPACPGGSGKECCAALETFATDTTDDTGERYARHCPAYPGIEGADGATPIHTAFPPSKAHRIDPAQDAGATGPDVPWGEIPPIDRTMVIANRTVEVVYRNRPMFDYVLAHELYHQEGLARVFERFAANRRANAPWHIDDVAATPDAAGVLPLSRIDFPVDSLMLKANWLPVSAAAEVGIDIARDGPFITVQLDPAEVEPKVAQTDHILLSLHISSKDIPNWVWVTFEHVNNQGRCDLIGCTDSFGYRAPTPSDFDRAIVEPAATPSRNYIAADQVTNEFGAGVDTLSFAARYALGERTPALAALFSAFGVADGDATDADDEAPVTPADPAWGMYRLKGSLVDFVSPVGVPRILGNSITEAGFSQSSSCMTCHAIAAVDRSGSMAFAIFRRNLSYLGFPKSVNGAPDPNRFAVQTGAVGTTGISEQLAVQTDFVWGFRFAKPLGTPPSGN